MGLNRLRETGYPMEFFAVLSEESMIPLCEQYGVKYCFYENLPLGKKKNYGLKKALEIDFDYLIELGSDDLLKNDLLHCYEPYFQQKSPLMGIRSFAFVDSENWNCRFYHSRVSTFGIGRAIRRDVIEKFDSKIWPDHYNSGLDNASHFLFAKNGILDRRVSHPSPLALDIKSEVNLWGFNHLEGVPYSIQLALNGLSKNEIQALKRLLKNVEA